MNITEVVKTRFWKMVCKQGSCWLWLGAKGSKGHGRFKINGKLESSHVISYVIKNGPVPEGMWILHTCDNPWCVNPEHLYIGTRSDNSKDALKRGRAKIPTKTRFKPGMAHKQRKLDIIQVQEIRSLLNTGEMGQRQIGKMYGINQKSVSRIKLNQRWKI